MIDDIPPPSERSRIAPEASPGTGSNDLSQLRDQVELIRGQVDVLQIQSSERKRPWYKQVSILISITALILSASFSTYSAFDQQSNRRSEERKKKLETLRQTMIQLTDIRKEQWSQFDNKERGTSSGISPISATNNNKRQLLIETAEAIIKDVRDHVSSNVFITLALELILDGRYADAEQYYELAKKASGPSPVSRRIALTGQAILYMQPGTPVYDMKKGQALFRDALELVKSNTDDYGRQVKGELYLYEAAGEFVNSDDREGNTLLEKSRLELSNMSYLNPQRKMMLDMLSEVKYQMNGKGALSFYDSLNDLTRQMTGEWDIVYDDEFFGTGKAVFVRDPATRNLIAFVDVFNKGKALMMRYSGPAIFANANTVRIDWQGTRFFFAFGSQSNNYGEARTALGQTTLKIYPGDHCKGHEHELGMTERSLSMKKKGH